MVWLVAALYLDEPSGTLDMKFSASEKQELMQENLALQEQMQDEIVDAAEDIQRKLGELSQLMNTFSVEILLQKEDMNRIIDTVTHSTVNVELGNQSLIEATSTSADFRFFVLMFLVIMSLALLFLHWYS